MTAHVGTLSVDGTPISRADLARIQAEERLHTEQQRRAVRVVASAATGADDCRMLLSILGLDSETIVAARADLAGDAALPQGAAAAKRPGKSRVAA